MCLLCWPCVQVRRLKLGHIFGINKHSPLDRMWMPESWPRWKIPDFTSRIDFCNRCKFVNACIHTRSGRLSSPNSTYGNSTDSHFRSKYECSSLIQKIRLRFANGLLWRDAKLSIRTCHKWCHHASSPISIHRNNTDTKSYSRSEYGCLSLVKEFRLRVANGFLWHGAIINVCMPHHLPHVMLSSEPTYDHLMTTHGNSTDTHWPSHNYKAKLITPLKFIIVSGMEWEKRWVLPHGK